MYHLWSVFSFLFNCSKTFRKSALRVNVCFIILRNKYLKIFRSGKYLANYFLLTLEM